MSTPEDKIEQDPEVKALLAKLGNQSPLPGPEVPNNQQPIDELDPEKVKQAQEEQAKKKGFKKGLTVVKAKAEQVNTQDDAQSRELSEKYKGVITAYSDVAANTLKKIKRDRKRILRAIKACQEVVESGGKVPRAYIEGWITALATLSDTNGHEIKLLDSFAKFMAAGKNSEVFQNLSVTLDSATLMKLLDADRYPDEDRHDDPNPPKKSGKGPKDNSGDD